MAKKSRPNEVVVINYSGQHANTRIALPVENEAPRAAPTATYVPRKSKRQKAFERGKHKAENRKRWQKYHEVELNETKRLLFKALRLLRKNKVAMPQEMSDVLARHEKRRPGRVGGRTDTRSKCRRDKQVHEFESA